MIRRISQATVLTLAVLAIAGCNKPASDQDSLLQEAREAGDDLSGIQAPQAPQLRIDPTDAPTKEPPPSTFAGQYKGSIPCAGCDGANSTLTLSADGSYTIERPAPNPGSNGHWVSEEGGTRLRLDPVRRDEGSLVWGVSADNTLKRLDEDGTPLARDVAPDVLARAR